MGFFLYELGRAEERSSISASLLGRAERHIGVRWAGADTHNPTYQTEKNGVSGDFLRAARLPNTPLVPVWMSVLEGLQLN